MKSTISQAEYRQALASGQVRLPGMRNGNKQVAGRARKRARDPEEELHRSCHSWNELQKGCHPVLEWIFHCPNGGGRSKAEAGMLKAMGVKSGVPDFVLPFPAPRWKGLAVELKSPDGRLSQKQREWLQRAYQDGWVVGVARTLDDYIRLVRCYFNGTVFDTHPGFREILRERESGTSEA